MISKLLIDMSSDVAEIIVASAENTLSEEEKEELFNTIFSDLTDTFRAYDATTISTMSNNLKSLEW